MMPDDKVERRGDEPGPIAPVTVAIIGTPPPAGAPLETGTVATTPDHHPDVVMRVITPLVAIVVRFANLYLTTLVGLLVAAMTPIGGKLLYSKDFWHMVLLCSSLAFPGAFLGLLKDLITVFGRLEGKYPLATGSI